MQQFSDCKQLKIDVVEIFYRSKNAKETIPYLNIKDEINLRKEPQNEYDSFAVKVIYSRIKLGYVPAKLSEQVTELINQKRIRKVIVDSAGEHKVYSWEEGNPFLTLLVFYK